MKRDGSKRDLYKLGLLRRIYSRLFIGNETHNRIAALLNNKFIQNSDTVSTTKEQNELLRSLDTSFNGNVHFNNSEKSSPQLKPLSRKGLLKIDFYFQFPETWSSLKSFWDACKADPRIQARIILLPFLHDSKQDDENAGKFLVREGIPFIHWKSYPLDQDVPHVVFLQNPYDSTRPPELHSEPLLRHGIRIAYIPYGLEVGGGVENLRLQYDLEVQQYAWRIFARSKAVADMYAKHCSAGNGHVVVSGHPRTDRFRQEIPFAVDPKLTDAIDGRKCFLWAPHFTVEDGGWSTYGRYGECILETFERRKDVVLIIRPHPLFFGRMKKLGIIDEDGERNLRQRFSQNNVILDERADYLHAFTVSDCLMCDAGSFFLEYLLTRKPIMYLDNPEGAGLNEIAQAMLPSYCHALSENDVIRFIDMIDQQQDLNLKERMVAAQDAFANLNVNVGEWIKDYVFNEILCESSTNLTR